MLLRRASVLGINEIHPKHQDKWNIFVTSRVPNTASYGSVSGDMIFWCLPQYLLTMPSGRHSLCRPPPGLFNHFGAQKKQVNTKCCDSGLGAGAAIWGPSEAPIDPNLML